MTRRCAHDGQPLTDHDQAAIDQFAAFLTDPDPDRRAAYARHYPEDAPCPSPSTTSS